MALELKQQLKLTQQLVMTPQLQQAIKLLQLSRLELVSLVQQELEENPVLEEAQEGEETQEGGEHADSPDLLDANAPAPEEGAGDAAPGEEAASVPDAPPEGAAEPEPTDADKIADVDWQDYLDAYPQTGMREVRGEDDRPPLEATLTRRTTLAEHLLWQLQLESTPGDEVAAAECIAGNLDERGYLCSTVEDIAKQAGVEIDVAERALALVQALDPTGVAARDLQECLTLQARTLGITDPIVLRILDEALDPLVQRDFRKVARELGISIEEVALAAKVIGHLEPRPGRNFGGDEPVYIVPDIYVYKIGDEMHVVLNDDGMPRLRVSNLYKEVLARGGKGGKVEKDTRNYVHDKVRSAMWLIKSIHQRQRTIYKVMQSILRFQRDFFDKGIEYLRPLNLRDVADDIEMHESTVSRVTTNKYVHTPQGIFELKYFFNSSINKLDGNTVASESVKDRILHLIKNEDSRRPLSDQRIAEMLRVHDINIARRTVTKYREALNLLSSTKRRQIG
ncbi:MAG: RNA polymerase factor sigma-54 [Deltaproteobacteria bacterium]|nr:RNA polymerase factor sigma-54 [Deltaproteobacteria bacterium]